MHKKYEKQSGNAFIIVIIGVIIVAVLGFIFWQNFVKQAPKTQTTTSDNQATSQKPTTLDGTVAGINKTLLAQACSGRGLSKAVDKSAFKQVSDSDQFSYESGTSLINTEFTYAYVQYGCGTQGSDALLEKSGDTWKLVSEDARIYPMCDTIRGQGFPSSIVDKCYVDDKSADPVAI